MPWYWIVIIISVIVGPFEALRAYNKLLKRREERQRMDESMDKRKEAE